ncbi:MAG: CHAT domain-containing protein [Planctomycetota bacterium]
MAIRLWERAAENDAADVAVRIDAYTRLARAHQSTGHYRDAALAFEKGLALAEHGGDERRALALKNGLGAVLTAMRSWQRAEALLVEALAGAEKTERQAAGAAILNNLGNLYAARGRTDAAREAYEEGAAADQHNAAALGLLERASGGPAKVYLRLTIGHTDANLLRRGAGPAEKLLGRAFESYRAALDLARRSGNRRAECFALGYLGSLYEARARHEEGLRLSRRAAFLAQRLQAPELLYRWQWQTGRLLRSLGQVEAALGALQQAVSAFESVRQEVVGAGNRSLLLDFREEVGAMYYDLADAHLRLAESAGEPERARRHMLKARDAVESFKTAEMVDYFQDRCIAEVREEARDIERLDPSTAVVYVVPLRDRTEVILSRGPDVRRFGIPVGSDELTAEVREFRRRLEDRSSHRYKLNAKQLYDWLVRPCEAELRRGQVSTLLFVPDGALRTIPMSALYDGERFLVERYGVAVAPGLALVAPRPFAARKAGVLACGISEKVEGFSRLQYVHSELRRIAELSGGTLLMNEQFRLSRLEREFAAGTPAAVHIASHGQFSSDPAHTFLLTHERRLTLDELEMLIRPSQFRGNPVELLTLSACQTAAGDDRAALGMAGVALKAGARSALATLWFVNDEASARLVAGFYENMYDHPGWSKARALRAAQTDIMRDRRYRHPCYWAPYLLIGNWL